MPTTTSAQTPGGVSSGLSLWLKADAGGYSDAGTTLATDGQTIRQWSDQSPSANHLGQVTSANRPTFQLRRANFNPALTFSKDQFLDVASGLGITATSDFTFFVVFKANTITTGGATDGSGDYIIDRTSGTNDLTSLKFSAGPNLLYQTRYNDGSGLGGPVAGISAGNFYIAEYHRDYNVEFGISINSGTKTTIASNTNNLTPPNIRLGRHTTTTNGGLDGDIAEVIVYSQYPSTADLQRINTYLGIKYGISLNQGTPQNYTASDGTTIFDAVTTFSSYRNNIAGIGRDDNAGLSQTRSIGDQDQLILNKGASFSNNLDFIVWGSDNGEIVSTPDEAHPSYLYRIERVWRTDLTGSPGAVSVSFLLTGGIGNSGNTSDYALLIKNTDPDFSTGVTPYTTGATISGDTLTFTGVSFSEGDYFTLATDLATPAPGGATSGLKLWLSVSGSTNCVLDGCTITSWTDKSTNGLTVTPVNNPIYRATAINFNPAVETSSDYFNVSSVNLNFSSGFEMFWVGRFDDGDGAVLTWNTASDYHSLLLDHLTTYGTLLGSGSSWIGLTDNTAYYGTKGASNEVLIGRIDHLGNGSTLSIHKNGGSAMLSGNATFTNSGANNMRIAARSTATQFYDGLISEVLIFNTSMTNEQKARIETYLAVKYGITRLGVDDGSTGAIDERDYIASNGTVIWDYSSNTGFHNDVTGIGRDYSSNLNQTKSKSENSEDIITIDHGGGFGADYDFLIWGNDNGLISNTGSADLPAGIVGRLERKWKAQLSGSVGSVSLQFDMSNVPGTSGPGTNDMSYLALLVDQDGDFSSGTTLVYPDSYDNGTQAVSFAHDFDTGTGYFFTLGSTSESEAPLPIELLNFEVTVESNRVKIEWKTATETNNEFFTLERSADGVVFGAVGTVKGAGTSNNVLSYQFFDYDPLKGRSYYRLKQTDFDGTFTYSVVQKAEVLSHLSLISLYPNPTYGEVMITGIADPQLITVQIHNFSGQKVAVTTRLEGDHAVMDFKNVPAGVYVVTVATPFERKTLKLIRK